VCKPSYLLTSVVLSTGPDDEVHERGFGDHCASYFDPRHEQRANEPPELASIKRTFPNTPANGPFMATGTVQETVPETRSVRKPTRAVFCTMRPEPPKAKPVSPDLEAEPAVLTGALIGYAGYPPETRTSTARSTF
jgi:hypothetical protein